MKKKILCLILCLTLLLPLLVQGVQAEQYRLYKVYIDAGQGAQEEWAIYSGGDLYIPAASYQKYTYFQYPDQESRRSEPDF